MIRLAPAHRLGFALLLLLSSVPRTQAQQNPKLTPVNYGNIVLTASNWPFLIAEQEGLFQKEGIDFKRVIGGNTTATTQALVAGSTDFAQMNLVNLLAANSAGADLIVIGGDSTVPIYTLIVHPSIKSYADLKGKRLAVTGPTDPLNYILARMKILLRKGYSGRRFTLSGARLAKIPELIYLLSPRELMPHSLYRISKAARETMRKDLTELIIVNYCEQVPNPESKVFLSQERDRLNMNRLILDWKVGAEETQTLVRLQALLDHYLRKHHMGYLVADSSEMSHAAGIPNATGCAVLNSFCSSDPGQ